MITALYSVPGKRILDSMEQHTAKHFVLQLGSLMSLYLVLSFALVLVFNLINLRFPDPAEGYYTIESAQGGVRLGIAMVIVFLPTYLILTRLVNVTRRANPTGTYLTLTKWLIYLSLLIGGGVLLGDLVAVIMAFLEGELTIRFLLKATSVLVVVGAAVLYYLLDARGYWLTNSARSLQFGAGAAAFGLAIVVTGFLNIETPATVREGKLDDKQIADLQEIQWRIESHITLTGTTPDNLDQLEGSSLPTAPAGRSAYEYQKTDRGFALCAEFALESHDGDNFTSPYDTKAIIGNAWDWDHAAGRHCFERMVNNTAPTAPAL